MFVITDLEPVELKTTTANVEEFVELAKKYTKTHTICNVYKQNT